MVPWAHLSSHPNNIEIHEDSAIRPLERRAGNDSSCRHVLHGRGVAVSMFALDSAGPMCVCSNTTVISGGPTPAGVDRTRFGRR